MSEPSAISTWPGAFGFASFMLTMMFALTAFFPAPWIICAGWMEERMKIKRILAEARLQEAKNAARQQEASDAR